MIESSQLQKLIISDAQMMQVSESISETPIGMDSFEGMIESFLNDEALLQSKIDIGVDLEGQELALLAEENVPLEEAIILDETTDGLNLAIEPEAVPLEEEATLVLHDVMLKPLTALQEQANKALELVLKSPSPIAQQGEQAEQVVVSAQPVTIHTKLQDLQASPDLDLRIQTEGAVKGSSEPKLMMATDMEAELDQKHQQAQLTTNQTNQKDLMMTADPDMQVSKETIPFMTPSKSLDSKTKSNLTESLARVDMAAVRQSSQATANTSPLQTTQTMLTQELNIPLNHEKWGQAFNEKLIMMAGRGMDKALIQIDPPELGPIEVSINMDKDGANLQFTTQHQSVRDLIENQINRLRTDFQASGIELLDVSVNHHDGHQFQEQMYHQAEAIELQQESVSPRQDSDGLLDIYV